MTHIVGEVKQCVLGKCPKYKVKLPQTRPDQTRPVYTKAFRPLYTKAFRPVYTKALQPVYRKAFKPVYIYKSATNCP